MSGVKWNPPPPGGEVTRSPVKVVFEGVPPGSVLARDLYQQFYGKISRFYLGQARNQQMGNLGYTKTQVRDGPLFMQYANIQGQEIVRVVVEASTQEQFAREKLPRQRDFILIDINYDQGWTSSVTHAAFAHIPGRTDRTSTKFTAYEATAEAQYPLTDDGSAMPLVAFPPLLPSKAKYSPAFPRAADGTQRSTLLIDLRSVRGVPAVVIDVHSVLTTAYHHNASCNLYRWIIDPAQSGGLINETITPFRSWLELLSVPIGAPPLVFPSDHYIPVESYTEDWKDVPPIVVPPTSPEILAADAPGFSGRLEIPYSYETFISRPNEQHPIPSAPSFDGTYARFDGVNVNVTRVDIYNPQYQWEPGPAEAVGVLTASFPSGDFGVSHTTGGEIFGGGNCDDYSGTQFYYSWEDMGVYPEHPVHIELGSFLSSTGETPPGTVENNYGMQPRFRLTYDQVHDSLSMTTRF